MEEFYIESEVIENTLSSEIEETETSEIPEEETETTETTEIAKEETEEIEEIETYTETTDLTPVVEQLQMVNGTLIAILAFLVTTWCIGTVQRGVRRLFDFGNPN